MQCQQIGIAGEDQVRAAAYGYFEELVIVWIAASANALKNLDEACAGNKAESRANRSPRGRYR